MLTRLLVSLLLSLVCAAQAFAGAATELTEAQYQTLKTDIESHAAEFAGKTDTEVASAYNLTAAPTFQVYKTAVTRKAILFEKSPTNTNFIFEGNGYLTLTVQELMTFHDFFEGTPPSMDASLENVQTGLDAIFKLPGNATNNRNHIRQQSVRAVTRAEKLYVTQGAGSVADPGILVWEGLLDHRSIAHAMRNVPLN
jgi:hypothetical protein